MKWLRDAIEAKMREQIEAEEAEILAVMLNPPPERIVHSPVVRIGHAYEIPSDHFEDGLPRLLVAEGQYLADEVLRAFS